eukprot:COSAG04_NODE_42_length_32379_cov_41.656691_27_plen_133_part_00
MGERSRAKDAAKFKAMVAQFLRSAGVSTDAEVVRNFLILNTQTVSGLGGGGRSAGYLHVCAPRDLDAAMTYRVTTLDRSAPVVGWGVAKQEARTGSGADVLNRHEAQRQLELKQKGGPKPSKLGEVASRIGG